MDQVSSENLLKTVGVTLNNFELPGSQGGQQPAGDQWWEAVPMPWGILAPEMLWRREQGCQETHRHQGAETILLMEPKKYFLTH